MNRKDIILIGLTPASDETHTPVQVQKLFFLLDRNIAKALGGPHFNFQPYNYGPFDKTVYETLEEMAREGLVEIVPMRTWKSYKLTPVGLMAGKKLFNGLPEPVKRYIGDVSNFVRCSSFTQLVAAIYKAYPEMRANSVFQG